MDVHVPALEGILHDAEASVVALGEAQCGPPGLLHDVAQLTVEDQSAVPVHHAGFDEHDIAAHRRVEHPRRHPHDIGRSHPLGMYPRASDQLPDDRAIDLETLDLARGNFSSDLPSQLA